MLLGGLISIDWGWQYYYGDLITIHVGQGMRLHPQVRGGGRELRTLRVTMMPIVTIVTAHSNAAANFIFVGSLLSHQPWRRGRTRIR